MFGRLHPVYAAFGGSVLLFGILVAMLYWGTPAAIPGREPVVVYCAAALRVPLEIIAADYQHQTGQTVELRFGPSEGLLSSIRVTGQGDLFLPADESYIAEARKHDLIADVLPLAQMTAVAIARPGYAGPMDSLADLTRPGVRLAQANPDAAAIGKLTREQLRRTGTWPALERGTTVFTGTVTEVANAVQLGSVDVGIVWDAVASLYPDVRVFPLAELKPVTARVELALLKASTRREAALQLAGYIADPAHGLQVLRAKGFRVVAAETTDSAGKARP